MEKELSKNEEIKSYNRKFIIKFIVFLIVLILITLLAMYFSIEYLEKKDKEEDITANNEIKTEEIKKVAEDSKYAIKSYTETYNTNSIKIIEYYDIDGNVVTEDKNDGSKYKSHIQYIQIDGLKDKNIQNKVNERLKKEAYELNSKFVYSILCSNFSNILSVEYYGDDSKISTLNIDLITGEDIPFNNIFVSSATINSYLAEGLYETLAWESLIIDEEGNYQNDMENVDTSEYEDKFIMIVNNYNKYKDNVKYSISPSSVSIYGLLDKKILDAENIEDRSIKIDLIEHMNEVAIYKRYLTLESIFEDDSLGIKNIVIFTGDAKEEQYMNRISYGKISDNIFIEEVLMNNFEQNDGYNFCKEYVKKLSREQQDLLKKQTPNNIGRFYQRDFNISYDKEEDYYIISSSIYQAICPISYFKHDAFKDYIDLNAIPKASGGLLGFTEYMANDFPNLEILKTEYMDYYISESGDFLGNSKEEVDKKMVDRKIKQ